MLGFGSRRLSADVRLCLFVGVGVCVRGRVLVGVFVGVGVFAHMGLGEGGDYLDRPLKHGGSHTHTHTQRSFSSEIHCKQSTSGSLKLSTC